MRSRWIWGMGLMLWVPLAWGLQIVPVQGPKRIVAALSAEALNRIAVKGDRIARVFGLSESVVPETDEASGQLFFALF